MLCERPATRMLMVATRIPAVIAGKTLRRATRYENGTRKRTMHAELRLSAFSCLSCTPRGSLRSSQDCGIQLL